MFEQLLKDSNLCANERMLSLRDEEKWRLIQAQARSQKIVDSPAAIIRKMEHIVLQLDRNAGASCLKHLERPVLDSLKVSFRTASVSWLETFVANGGCELMVDILKRIYPERYCRPNHALDVTLPG